MAMESLYAVAEYFGAVALLLMVVPCLLAAVLVYSYATKRHSSTRMVAGKKVALPLADPAMDQGQTGFLWAPSRWLDAKVAEELIGAPPPSKGRGVARARSLSRTLSGRLVQSDCLDFLPQQREQPSSAAGNERGTQTASPSTSMERALEAIRAAMREDGLLAEKDCEPPSERLIHEPIDDYVIVKFLLVAKHETQKAIETLRNYVAWRRQHGVIKPPDAWLDLGVVRLPLEDHHGRPMVFIHAKRLKVPVELAELGFCATLDAVIAHLLSRRASGATLEGNQLDQYVSIVDVSGCTRQNFSRPILQMMMRVATLRYAERSGQVFILHPNMAAQMFWKMVRPLLLERTQKNIQLVATSDVPRVMRELVGEQLGLLPSEYGGRAEAWLAPEHARTLDEKAGSLAAAAWRQLGVAPPWDATMKGDAAGDGDREDLAASPAAAMGRRQQQRSLKASPSCSTCFDWLW